MTRPSFPGPAARLVTACLALAALSGCGASRETAPQAPGAAQVTGSVNRAGAPVAGLKVKLSDDASGAQVDSTYSDASGAYGFSGIPAGKWMVKVSPSDAGDFGYVRFFLDFASDGQTAVVPPFDISAHGLGLLAPSDDDTLDRPSFSSPIHFTWSGYQATFSWMNARLSDVDDAPVWSSAQSQGTAADWNGIGNEGSYAGTVLPAGTYTWRVRIHPGNGVQAATRIRTLVLR